MMKFKSTTTDNLNTIPKEDSIVVTTDTSLVGYCANNALYKVNKPEWLVLGEPNVKLISDGILSQLYANKLQFGSNNGAGSCQAYQKEAAYYLAAPTFNDVAWIRWKVNFDDVDYAYIKWQFIYGYDTVLSFRISDGIYDPSVSSKASVDNDKAIYTEYMTSGSKTIRERTLDITQYTGTHWLYIFTNSFQSQFNLFDIELRKASE